MQDGQVLYVWDCAIRWVASKYPGYARIERVGRIG